METLGPHMSIEGGQKSPKKLPKKHGKGENEKTRPRRPTMRPYSVMRMFEFLVVAVIEEMVGDSFNPHFTESMTLRSFISVSMTLRSFPSENLTLRSFPSENMTFRSFPS